MLDFGNGKNKKIEIILTKILFVLHNGRLQLDGMDGISDGDHSGMANIAGVPSQTSSC